MATEEFQRPQNHENVGHRDIIISPRFRSVAARAGWDEEDLLAASSVEDTPERESSKLQKRTNLASKSPQTNSRRTQGNKPKSDEMPPANLPCMDKLREELSCAICLEICFEPSTTPCGHSFCKKCLKSAADKCGKKCPKCRQLIGLWNTIQLLFPREVEARKAVAAKKSREQVKDQTHWSTVGEDSISRSRSGRTNSMVMTTDRSNIRVSSSSRNQSGRSNLMEMNREDSALSSSERIRSNIRVSSSSRNQSGRSNFMGMNREDSVRLSISARIRSNISVSSSSRNGSGRSNFTGMDREDSVSLSSSERIRRARPSQAKDAALALRLQREEFMVAFRAADEPKHQPQVPAEASTARANLRAMDSRAIDTHHRRRLA